MFQILFGFLVILFLLLVYLIQGLLTHFVRHKAFNFLKEKLVQAFLLTVLFSYQKLVMGSFMLVQCVDIEDNSMLFIQADIPCYNWWQICVLVYICIGVVPIFFVLAHCPFYVEDKKMSVKIFILACLFPLPVMIGYHVVKVLKRNHVRQLPFRHRIETLEMVEISIEEKIEKILKEVQQTSTNSNDSNEQQIIEKSESLLTMNDVKIVTDSRSLDVDLSDSSEGIVDDQKSKTSMSSLTDEKLSVE